MKQNNNISFKQVYRADIPKDKEQADEFISRLEAFYEVSDYFFDKNNGKTEVVIDDPEDKLKGKENDLLKKTGINIQAVDGPMPKPHGNTTQRIVRINSATSYIDNDIRNDKVLANYRGPLNDLSSESLSAFNDNDLINTYYYLKEANEYYNNGTPNLKLTPERLRQLVVWLNALSVEEIKNNGKKKFMEALNNPFESE